MLPVYTDHAPPSGRDQMTGSRLLAVLLLPNSIRPRGPAAMVSKVWFSSLTRVVYLLKFLSPSSSQIVGWEPTDPKASGWPLPLLNPVICGSFRR
jgi:hypothetical protein